MRKLSQKELVEEGFGDLVKGAVKSLGRGALAATKGLAKTITPTGSGMLKAAGDTMGKAFTNIALEDPKTVIKSYLASSQGKKTIINGQIGAEKKLPGGYREVELSGEYVGDPRLGASPFSTKIILVKGEKGWEFAGDFDKKGNFTFNPNKKDDSKSNKKRQVVSPRVSKKVTPNNKSRLQSKVAVSQKPTASSNTSSEDVTTANFKQKLKEFKAQKPINEPGIGYSTMAVSEFVRSLAKRSSNLNWSENLPKKLRQIKSSSGNWTNNELIDLTNRLKQDGILKESQKNLLKHLQLLSK